MLWTEVRKWTKELGYDAIKNKEDGKYYWALLDNDSPIASGVVPSVSKLAKAIFNHHTNDKWVDHQTEFQNKKEEKKFSVSDYGS